MGPGFYELEAYAIVCVCQSRGEVSKEKNKQTQKNTHTNEPVFWSFLPEQTGILKLELYQLHRKSVQEACLYFLELT